jgi:hypothetical protein
MQLDTPLRALALLAAIVTTGPMRAAEHDFKELLGKVPGTPNVLVMLNPEKIFASEVATKGGWKQQYGSTFADTPLLMPPSAEQFVLAADLDLAYLHPRWQTAVMRLNADPSKEQIAQKIGGQADELAGLDVVAAPRGGMIVRFAPNVFGMRQPGDRQTVGRWIRDTATPPSTPTLSPYLQAAADVPDRVGTEIIMAIDLTDAIPPAQMKKAISESDVLREHSVERQAATFALSSIRGLTIGARVTNRVYGVLKVDFDQEVTVLKDVAKPLLLETLGEAGAMIDEFENWDVKVTSKRITLEGELTQSGLRRLFSFLEMDTTAVHDHDAEAKPAAPLPGDEGPDAYKSLQYYQSVQRYLHDLKGERGGAKSYYTIAVWFDKYAKRIDRLPILGVDKDLVDYGQRTVSQMRDCVEAIRGGGIESGAQAAQVNSSNTGYGYYGGYGSYPLYGSSAQNAAAEVGAVEQQRRAIRAQERGQSSTDVRAIIRDIEQDSSNVRRQMTERYDMEFTDRPRSN